MRGLGCAGGDARVGMCGPRRAGRGGTEAARDRGGRGEGTEAGWREGPRRAGWRD